MLISGFCQPAQALMSLLKGSKTDNMIGGQHDMYAGCQVFAAPKAAFLWEDLAALLIVVFRVLRV